MASGFQTYQTSSNYDSALGRHGQWVRWLKGSICPCANVYSKQPDPQCSLCKGRGYLYRNPDNLIVNEEKLKYISPGKYALNHYPLTDIISIKRQNIDISYPEISLQIGNNYISINPPYYKPYQQLIANYEFTPKATVEGENSEVIGENTLRTIASRFTEKGKEFESSIDTVSRVYNVTKEENYTVSTFAKDYIYLSSMGNWEPGDVLEVDYTYVYPFYFIISGVTAKMKYDKPYIMDEADAILVAPSWAKLSSDDFYTALSQELYSRVIVNPSSSLGNDIIKNVFDLSRILHLEDTLGNEYKEGTNFVIYDRNQIKWITVKPATNYALEYAYHPTYKAIGNMATVRNAENKEFVNKINIKLFNGANEALVI